MSTDNDDAVPLAVFLSAGVAAAVIAGVMAVVVFSKPKAATQAEALAVAAAPAAVPAAAAAQLSPVTLAPSNTAENLYFAVGSADLPPDASEKLNRIADAARANAGTSVLISGHHDAKGGATQNAELAKLRAVAVRHALEANGVAPDRLQMSKPVETTGGTDPQEARRVELRLQ